MNVKVSDYITRQNARDLKMEKALEGLQKDSAAQAALIETLQNSPGDTWTPDDQTSLDALEANNDRLVAGFEALDAVISQPVEPPSA